MNSNNIGVYCLANDKVLDWMIAFLESLRYYEPKRELIIIPFDDDTALLSKLSEKYNFTFLQDETLPELDKLGMHVDPNDRGFPIHPFRKFASFWGPFEHFIFLDADIVVLSQLDEIFETYLRSNLDFIYFDCNINRAYKEGNFREEMIEKHAAAGFNSGAFVSSKRIFSMKEIQEFAENATSIRDNFVSRYEQSFLNYCVDSKGLKKNRYCNLSLSAPCSYWAKLSPIKHTNGEYRIQSHKNKDFGKILAFLHWAGFENEPMMPNRRIYLKFRYMNKPKIMRIIHYGFDTINYLIVGFKASIRRVQKFL